MFKIHNKALSPFLCVCISLCLYAGLKSRIGSKSCLWNLVDCTSSLCEEKSDKDYCRNT